MIVFSTLRPDRIDLSRTQARAVTDLKHFLEYAERGASALAAAVYGSIDDFENPFEVAVGRELRNRGWELHPQVGVSAYRIDLGIVHPDLPGVYLAGVECDGATYHSSAFAQERDKIRQSVLEGLGWKLFRVWSTDWWINRTKSLELLDQQLLAHLDADRQVRAEAEAESQPDEILMLTDETGALDDTDQIDDDYVDLPSSEFERVVTLPTDPLVDFIVSGQGVYPDETDESQGEQYLYADLYSEDLEPRPDKFYEASYRRHLGAMIEHVVKVEGPIHEDLLVRRIARHHGFQRAGRQIREIVHKLARKLTRSTTENVGTFYWSKSEEFQVDAPARYLGRNDETKKVDYICKEELHAIWEHFDFIDEPAELANEIGISRVTTQTKARLTRVLGLDAEE